MDTQIALDEIGYSVDAFFAQEQRIPTDLDDLLKHVTVAPDAEVWLREEYNSGKDQWGNPLVLWSDGQVLSIASGGADGRFEQGHGDDLVNTVSIPSAIPR